MLNDLDTFIGFAVIMTLLSMLITVGTQMVSALLAMRGKNLANALAITLRTIDPDIGHQAEEVVEHLLSRPGISDSIFSPTRPTSVSSKPSPDLAAAEHLAGAEAEAQATQAQVDDAKQRLAALEVALATAEAAVAAAAQADLPAAQNARDQCLQNFQQGAQVLAAARVAARHPALRVAAARVAAVGASSATPDPDGGRAWKVWQPGGYKLTDAVRADEVYRLLHAMAAHTPAEAVGHGLSAFTPWKVARLLERVKTPAASDVEAAGKVSATLQLLGANGLLKDGSDLLNGLGRFDKAVEAVTAQGYDRFEAWFISTGDRARQWFSTHTRLATIGWAVLLAFGLQLDLKDVYQRISTDSSLRAALVNSAPDVVKQGGTILAEQPPPKHVSDASPTPTPSADAQAALQKATADYKTLTEKITDSAYDIIPTKDRWSKDYMAHFWGMSMMAALLSIGAPFWFNILKGLSNLRPSIAQVVQDQPTQTPNPASDTAA